MLSSMSMLYRKTEKGQAEVTTRANRLPPRLRAALIMVDGKRSADELSNIIPAEPETTLQWLMDSGFIERTDGSANTSMWGTTGAGVGASSQDMRGPGNQAGAAAKGATTSPATGTWPEGSVASRTPIERIKKDAVRELIAMMGPVIEGLAIKIERARSREELKPLLDLAYQNLQNARGPVVANEFHARYIEGMMV